MGVGGCDATAPSPGSMRPTAVHGAPPPPPRILAYTFEKDAEHMFAELLFRVKYKPIGTLAPGPSWASSVLHDPNAGSATFQYLEEDDFEWTDAYVEVGHNGLAKWKA